MANSMGNSWIYQAFWDYGDRLDLYEQRIKELFLEAVGILMADCRVVFTFRNGVEVSTERDLKIAASGFRGFPDILPAVFMYGNKPLLLIKYDVGCWVHLPFFDFRAFDINAKTVAPTQKLYQSGHII